MPEEQVNRFRGARIWRLVASGLGAGYAPVAPGTAGSLLALPLWYLGDGRGPVHYVGLAAVALLALPAARAAMRETGDRDPPWVVIDEVLGMLIASTGIPWGWSSVPLLFLLFRLFDIVKWGPTARLDALDGAVYVVADDLVAGLLANLAFRGIAWLTA